MDLKVLKEKDVPLLERKRVSLMATFEGKSTPSKDVLRKEVAAKLKLNPELVAIRHIYQRYGTTDAKIIAHVYKDVKNLKYLEGDKGLLKAEAPKEEAPKEEPKEEEGKE